MPPDCHIEVDGVPLTVPAGCTVAAALAIAGTLCTRVSVRGEPRFALCGMGQCQECRVSIDGAAHQLACQVRVRDGMWIVSGEGAR
ncbi:MAG TPA: (2Fe-2S)-binding protein [Telluria sp.]|nr:(2Fe-2S)-binding protein [Telluria sp.]